MTHTDRRPASPLLMVAGFVIWASAFSLLYAALSAGCAFGWNGVRVADFDLNRLILMAIWIGHLMLLVGLQIYCFCLPEPANDGMGSFTRRIAIGSTAGALVATIWTGLAIPAVTPCV
jgi:hypothetical protein